MVATLLVLRFVFGSIAEARRFGTVLGLVAAPLGFLLLGELCGERPSARHTTTRVTARTLIGMAPARSRVTTTRSKC
ncbi:hypothetical protein ACH492_08675 [Streptomyces sp. NPDC019443]|uniref:hypothetical protein n=1 Tax=Streptomyces sp. NPDC019443 TaxID=3365061 RepID=UPI0037960DD7